MRKQGANTLLRDLKKAGLTKAIVSESRPKEYISLLEEMMKEVFFRERCSISRSKGLKEIHALE